ncbi:hypothetical protein [Pantoea sp. Lu_F5_004]|jgi:hypothetical protein|uniref:hypothetical protein n=1 Tax=Pantoea sp. Lu_F5_004 TaxID=3443507 RepID=UPI003EB6FD4B
MENAVGIKIDYEKNRNNPEQIFSAMALYISAYKKYCNLIAKEAGSELNYNLCLKDIEKGSIKALLGSISSCFHSLITKQSNGLFEDLTDEDDIISPNQVDSLARKQENKMEKINGDISFYIDRVEFAKILQEISAANEMLYRDERAEIETFGNSGNNIILLNTKMRFFGDPETMFDEHNIMSYRGRDSLDIIKPVNFGDSQWQVRSRTTHKTFMATIGDKEWLKLYQNGEIPIITAKYCMLVDMYCELDKKNKKPIIKKALIIKVIKVIPSSEAQDALL